MQSKSLLRERRRQGRLHTQGCWPWSVESRRARCGRPISRALGAERRQRKTPKRGSSGKHAALEPRPTRAAGRGRQRLALGAKTEPSLEQEASLVRRARRRQAAVAGTRSFGGGRKGALLIQPRAANFSGARGCRERPCIEEYTGGRGRSGFVLPHHENIPASCAPGGATGLASDSKAAGPKPAACSRFRTPLS